jgi:hypothetical protein
MVWPKPTRVPYRLVAVSAGQLAPVISLWRLQLRSSSVSDAILPWAFLSINYAACLEHRKVKSCVSS